MIFKNDNVSLVFQFYTHIFILFSIKLSNDSIIMLNNHGSKSFFVLFLILMLFTHINGSQTSACNSSYGRLVTADC